jgi:hypothetical protein
MPAVALKFRRQKKLLQRLELASGRFNAPIAKSSTMPCNEPDLVAIDKENAAPQ